MIRYYNCIALLMSMGCFRYYSTLLPFSCSRLSCCITMFSYWCISVQFLFYCNFWIIISIWTYCIVISNQVLCYWLPWSHYGVLCHTFRVWLNFNFLSIIDKKWPYIITSSTSYTCRLNILNYSCTFICHGLLNNYLQYQQHLYSPSQLPAAHWCTRISSLLGNSR